MEKVIKAKQPNYTLSLSELRGIARAAGVPITFNVPTSLAEDTQLPVRFLTMRLCSAPHAIDDLPITHWSLQGLLPPRPLEASTTKCTNSHNLTKNTPKPTGQTDLPTLKELKQNSIRVNSHLKTLESKKLRKRD